MRKTTLVVLAIILAAVPAAAQQLSKIAVVNVSKIIENFPSSSQAFRRLELLRAEYDQKMAEYQETLAVRKQRYDEAKVYGTEQENLDSQRAYEEYVNFIRSFNETMVRRINLAREQLREGEGIIQEILKAIEYVAINEGYTLVFDSAEQNILWWSKEVDITDRIIQRLRATSRFP